MLRTAHNFGVSGPDIVDVIDDIRARYSGAE